MTMYCYLIALFGHCVKVQGGYRVLAEDGAYVEYLGTPQAIYKMATNDSKIDY